MNFKRGRPIWPKKGPSVGSMGNVSPEETLPLESLLSSSGSESSYRRDRPRWRRKANAGPGAPKIDPDLDRIARPTHEFQLTWIGHASFLVQLANVNLLIDPVLSHKRIGLRKRHVAPGLEIDQLPDIHGVLISHEHSDHLDEWTLERLPRNLHAIVPEGLGSYLQRQGFRRVTELDWWQSVELEDPQLISVNGDSPSPQEEDRGPSSAVGSALDVPAATREFETEPCALTVTFTPARHGSPNAIFQRAGSSTCGGFIIEDSHHAIYHSGDTGFFDGFEEIGRRFPALDAALLPVGSYRREEKGASRHLNPEEAGRAFLQTGAARMIPMHWGTFQLADEPLREGADRLRTWWSTAALGDERRLDEMAIGQTIGWD